MRLRPFEANDLPAIAELFTASIHGLAGAHYDAPQRRAWAPQPPDLDEWRGRLEGLQTLVADAEGELAGFIAFAMDGHIDLLYTAPQHARRGVAAALYRETEAVLRAAGVVTLYTEASLVAQPFFSRAGFHIVEEQQVLRRDVVFRRYAMHKTLD